MTTFEKCIYLSICEITIKQASKSHFLTHSKYCKALLLSINDKKLNDNEINKLMDIYYELHKIYSFPDTEGFQHIVNFLSLDEEIIRIFEGVVKTTKSNFFN